MALAIAPNCGVTHLGLQWGGRQRERERQRQREARGRERNTSTTKLYIFIDGCDIHFSNFAQSRKKKETKTKTTKKGPLHRTDHNASQVCFLGVGVPLFFALSHRCFVFQPRFCLGGALPSSSSVLNQASGLQSLFDGY